jgi:AcrR family transcriptional regulator
VSEALADETANPNQTASPNQTAKREALIAAASEVLRTGGLAACTARAIADASPLSKSALHYYFDDVNEIVDLAFRQLIDRYLARVRAAADGETDPVEALWAAARVYLELGSDRPGRVPMLWFEIQVDAGRRGELGTIAEFTEMAFELFTDLVTATGADRPAQRASALFSALIGTVVRAEIGPIDLDVAIADLAAVSGLDRRELSRPL